MGTTCVGTAIGSERWHHLNCRPGYTGPDTTTFDKSTATIQRIDNVVIFVDDLEAAAFFTELCTSVAGPAAPTKPGSRRPDGGEVRFSHGYAWRSMDPRASSQGRARVCGRFPVIGVIPEEAGRGQGGMTWGFAERLVLSGAG